MIRVESLSRAWEPFALRSVSLEVAPGEYWALLGPTGCGKTLLLETIAGLHRDYEGQIWIDNVDMARTPAYRRNIGFVYQRSMLFPHLTARQNIEYGLRVRKAPALARKAKVDELASLLGIQSLLDRGVTSLSGGESQKVALARALAIEPAVLLLDEPLAPLDQPTKEELRDELRRVHEELKTTTIHVTHDHATARALGDQIAVMRAGGIVQTGDPTEVFARPANDFVARFIGTPNILLGLATPAPEGGAWVELEGQRLAVDTSHTGPVGLSIPPPAVELLAARAEQQNVLNARIKAIEYHYTLAQLRVEIGAQTLHAELPASEARALLAEAGDNAVYVRLDPGHLHVFPVE